MQRYDLIVVGGGFAGVGAALAAAREGMKVLLIDRHNCLGGTAVGSLVNPFMPYWTTDPDTNEKIPLAGGIFAEIVDAMKQQGYMTNDADFFDEGLKLVLNRMMLQAGIQLLFHSYLVDAQAENGYIQTVTVVNKSGKQTYFADYFIDATGDGDLAALCGCAWKLGRDKDQQCQPMSLCFRMAPVDTVLFKKEKPFLDQLFRQYQKEGKIKNILHGILAFGIAMPNVLHLNSTRLIHKNPLDAMELTEAEIEGRELVFELYHFLKSHSAACKESQLIMTASEIGVRESRKIIGDYCLTQEDLLACRKFEDSICACNYDIDIHSPDGGGASHYFFAPGEYYTIPYRCLTPKGMNNMLVAGRCISSTHEAQASFRIMPVCCCLGQAAGTAASLAKNNRCDIRKISISELQNLLVQHGAKI